MDLNIKNCGFIGFNGLTIKTCYFTGFNHQNWYGGLMDFSQKKRVALIMI